jgi:hypothetical protein
MTILETAEHTVTGSSSVVGFRDGRSGDGPWRALTIDGKPAYDLGTMCDTCDFVFERMTGANQSVELAGLADDMRAGLSALDASTVTSAGRALPDGDYRVALLDVVPQLIWPGDEHDYFTHEQLDVWEIDSFWGLPHNPKVSYFRTNTRRLPPDALLFEFVVPMFPPRWLDDNVVKDYRSRAARGEHATALAVSVLDVRQPANWSGDPEITKHWCLAHFLLDGNHRVYGASQAAATARILAFVSLDWSIATGAEVEQALLVLGRPPEPTSPSR